jgi:hypothetical protein
MACAALAALAGLAGGAGARAPEEVETRDFVVLVDGKPAGDAHMTIRRQEDGTFIMTCDTDIKVKVLIATYTYSYRGREVWKDGRLQHFQSTCSDDGKRFEVLATAEGNALRVRVNGQERMARPDVWLTSYWRQPDNRLVNQTVPLIDADNGRDLEAQVLYVGAEQRNLAGQAQNLQHFRLQGKAPTDLWYDAAGRIARQEWMEEGHRTVLELVRLRR